MLTSLINKILTQKKLYVETSNFTKPLSGNFFLDALVEANKKASRIGRAKNFKW